MKIKIQLNIDAELNSLDLEDIEESIVEIAKEISVHLSDDEKREVIKCVIAKLKEYRSHIR